MALSTGPSDAMVEESLATIQAGPALALARPEVIQLGRAAGARPGPGITWTGLVRQRFFRGTRNLYTVEVGPYGFNVDAPPAQPFIAGIKVSPAVDAADTWTVRE